jgi:hypothetical protein
MRYIPERDLRLCFEDWLAGFFVGARDDIDVLELVQDG